MKITLSSITKYLNNNTNDASHIEKILMQCGIEVEDIMERLPFYKISKIIKIEQHPNADTLKVCQMSTGESIVCGATNTRVGMHCILAEPGAIIPKTNQQIKICKVRGVESQGMLCSGDELMIDEDSDCIIDVKEFIGEGCLDSNIDRMCNKTLNDILMPNGPILDLSIPANRGDLMSAYGIAREISAYGGGELVELKSSNTYNIGHNKQIESSDKINFFYLLQVTEVDVSTKMQREMYDVGIFEKNPLQLLLRYILYNFGQPILAIDTKKLDELIRGESAGNLGSNHNHTIQNVLGKINFTHYRGDFEFEQKIYNVNSEALTYGDICLSIPTVGVSDRLVLDDSTKGAILLIGNYTKEYAYKTEKQVVRNPFSKQFIYGISNKQPDIVIQYLASKYNGIAYCVKELLGQSTRSYACVMPDISQSFIDKSLTELGFIKEIGADEQRLGSLENDLDTANDSENDLKYTANGSQCKYIPPSWRDDILDSQDLEEEVYKKFDINNIDPQKVNICMRTKQPIKYSLYRGFLAKIGLVESLRLHFISKYMSQFFPVYHKISNPMKPKYQYGMRPSIVPGLIELASYYLRQNWVVAGFFEKGPIFKETQASAIGILTMPKSDWYAQKNEYFYSKSLVERNLPLNAKCEKYQSSAILNGCKWSIDGRDIGYFGEISPEIAKNMKIKQKIYAGEIYTDFINYNTDKLPYTDIAYITRDISLSVPKCFETLKRAIVTYLKDHYISLSLLDVYRDEAVTIRLTWQGLDTTPTNEEIASIIAEVENIIRSLGCDIR